MLKHKAGLLVIGISRKFLKNTPAQKWLVVEKIFNFVYGFIKRELPTTIKFHGFPFEINLGDASLNPSLLDGSFERNEIMWLKERIVSRTRNQIDQIVFIDIGANIGIYSVIIGSVNSNSKNVRVLSFEPDTRNMEKLKTNISLNGLSNIETFPMAVAAINGQVRFVIEENHGTNHISTDIDERSIEVPCKTLESIINTDVGLDFSSLIIKIDVEGFEGDILNSSFSTLKHLQPDILFEVSGIKSIGGRTDTVTAIIELSSHYDHAILFDGGKLKFDDEAVREVQNLGSRTANFALFNHEL